VWQATGTGLPAFRIGSALALGVSPTGAVYVGGVNNSAENGLFTSQDNGVTWSSIDVGSNKMLPHTDQHSWGFYAFGVYNGNDGGIYRFSPPPFAPGIGTWESLNTPSLQTILSQGLGLHPQYPPSCWRGLRTTPSRSGTSGHGDTWPGATPGGARSILSTPATRSWSGLPIRLRTFS